MTAYDETRYYAKAMSLNICDFILKNADANAICAVVDKVRRKIEEERAAEGKSRQADGSMKDHLFVLQSTFISDVLSGKESEDSIVKKAIELGFRPVVPYYALIMLDIGNADFWTAINFTLQSFLGLDPFIFRYRDMYFTVLVNLKDEDVLGIELYAANLRKLVVFSRCVVMAPVSSLSALLACGTRLLAWADRCCWRSPEECFFIPLDSPPPVPMQKILAAENKLIRAILQDEMTIRDDMERWYNCMHSCHSRYRSVTQRPRQYLHCQFRRHRHS